MKPEQKFWKFLQPKFKTVPHLEVERVENRVSKSMPDVAYTIGPKSVGIHGWIELKVLTSAGNGPGFTIPHFTPGQRSWMRRRGSTGGYVWLLLRTPEHIYLFDHMEAQEVRKLGKSQFTARWRVPDFGIQELAEHLMVDARNWG